MGDTKGILAIIYTYKWHLYMCKIYIIYVMGKKVMCCFVTEVKCKKKTCCENIYSYSCC